MTIITAKLKLLTTQAQHQLLRQTQLAYRDALNHVSQFAFHHGKTTNIVLLHHHNYSLLREKYRLPSQLACTVFRQVSATYKGLWTKVKKNAHHRKAGYTKKRYKGLDKAPHYSSPTLSYQYRKDYSFKAAQHVSLNTIAGRLVVPYEGYSKHVQLLLQSRQHIGEAKLWYNKSKQQFYLLVSVDVEIPKLAPAAYPNVIGIDVGIRNLAVVSHSTGQAAFYSGKQVVSQANHYARVRKRLQQKDTRAAKKRLVSISGRERRFKQDANHVLAHQIVTQNPHTLIGLEHLTDIRERTRRRKKRGTPKQRRANAAYSKWSFAELQSMIDYKAALYGCLAVKVDAYYTSQQCPMCGYTHEANRPAKGLTFQCQNDTCGYELHADLVGARNVNLRTISIRQDWIETGGLSAHPDETDDEAKAARLKRYAELRWSSVSSSAF